MQQPTPPPTRVPDAWAMELLGSLALGVADDGAACVEQRIPSPVLTHINSLRRMTVHAGCAVVRMFVLLPANFNIECVETADIRMLVLGRPGLQAPAALEWLVADHRSPGGLRTLPDAVGGAIIQIANRPPADPPPDPALIQSLAAQFFGPLTQVEALELAEMAPRWLINTVLSAYESSCVQLISGCPDDSWSDPIGPLAKLIWAAGVIDGRHEMIMGSVEMLEASLRSLLPQGDGGT